MSKCTRLFILGIIIFMAGFGVLYRTVLNPPLTRETSALRKALVGVTEVRVRTGGMCHRVPELEKRLFTLDGRQSLELIYSLRATEMGSSCQCCGDYTFEFYRGRKLIAGVSLHHWDHLRWPDGTWNGDAKLDGKSLRYIENLMRSHGVQVTKF